MTGYMPDLDCYETGEWPEPTECRDCNGGGILYPATWIDPAEWCETCEGTGVRDCNCPGLCRVHDAHTLPEIDLTDWVDPWAGYTEPPF